VGGPFGTHRFQHLEREAQAAVNGAAELITAFIREGGQERRQQIAVGHMQLEHVKFRLQTETRSPHEIGAHLIQVSTCHFDGRLAELREIRQGRGCHQRPITGCQRMIHLFPAKLRGALASRMPELQADFSGCSTMHEIDDGAPGVPLGVVPQAGTAGRDAGVAADARHLGKDQASAADGARAVMHQMEIAGHALLRRIHAHRRYHGAVGHLHLAQLQRLEHRRHRLVDVDVKTF